jgi:beta-N-acetylhexosaminidase
MEKRMDLRTMLGQLFLLGFQGMDVSNHHPIVADISKRNLGGVILFDRLLAKNLKSNNIIGATQVKNMTESLQEVAGNRLLIGVDQEGGKVCRLTSKGGFPVSTNAADLGARNDAVLTEIHALATADMLKCLGININLAPVVDLNIFPDNPIIGALGRSFSSKAEIVTEHAKVWIEAHRSRNILSCLKHFPGHGSSRTDSHLGFVDISGTWSREELLPFTGLIGQGLADVIMTGHLFNGSLDSRFPATLSRDTISGLLRTELRFDGVVITDDIQMKAITDRYGLEEIVSRTFSAGVDMIVIGNNLDYDPEILEKAIQATLRCLKKGFLTEEVLVAALKRVRRLKDRHFAR